MYASVWVKLNKVELLTTHSFVERLRHGSWRRRGVAQRRVSVVGMATRVALCMGVDAAIILCISLRAPIAYKRRVLYSDAKVSAVWWFVSWGGRSISRRRSCRVVPCRVLCPPASASSLQQRSLALGNAR
jgi:hypothetical protein